MTLRNLLDVAKNVDYMGSKVIKFKGKEYKDFPTDEEIEEYELFSAESLLDNDIIEVTFYPTAYQETAIVVVVRDCKCISKGAPFAPLTFYKCTDGIDEIVANTSLKGLIEAMDKEPAVFGKEYPIAKVTYCVYEDGEVIPQIDFIGGYLDGEYYSWDNGEHTKINKENIKG